MSVPTPARPPPALERLGARYLSSRAAKVQAAPAPPVTESQQRAFARLKWVAISRAAAAGVLSSALIGTVELLASGWWPGEDWESRLRFWGVTLSVTLAVAVFEILFLFWNALDATSRVARIAGVESWLGPREGGQPRLDRPLARAALELPNPRDGYPGVDPLREASRAALLLATVVYKAKVAATSFILKTLVKRGLGRAAVRTMIVPFVAIPVTALWNGVVTAKIVKQARIRALGPRAVARATGRLFGAGVPQSPQGRLAVVRAVAAGIVRSRDLHPNLELFLDAVHRQCPAGAELLDDPREFLAMLRTLPEAERDASLLALGLAASLDGRLTRREVALLHAAHAAAGRPLDLELWRRVARAVAAGEELPLDGLPTRAARAA